MSLLCVTLNSLRIKLEGTYVLRQFCFYRSKFKIITTLKANSKLLPNFTCNVNLYLLFGIQTFPIYLYLFYDITACFFVCLQTRTSSSALCVIRHISGDSHWLDTSERTVVIRAPSTLVLCAAWTSSTHRGLSSMCLSVPMSLCSWTAWLQRPATKQTECRTPLPPHKYQL